MGRRHEGVGISPKTCPFHLFYVFLSRMRMHTRLFFLIILQGVALFASSASVFAESATSTSDTIVNTTESELDEVVVTSRRIPGKISSATPVQTLSSADLSRLGVQDMADAVRRFAGTNVKDYGGVGGLKTVSVRNMGAAHTAVSYDGSPVSNCQAGQIDIGRFSLDNVGMLSLSVGQADEMLQCARLYASAAVLGISTSQPVFEDKPYKIRGKVSGGSFGYISPSFRWWQKIGERVTGAIDADFLHSDGSYPFNLVNGDEITKEKRSNSEIDSRHVEGNLRLSLPQNGELHLKGYYYFSKRGLPGAITLYNPVTTEKLWDENAFVNLQYKNRFNHLWSLQAQGKYSYGWNRDLETGPQFDQGLYKATHRQDEWFLSATGLYQPDPRISIAFAEDGSLNTLRSTMYECPDPVRYSSISALSMRFSIPSLTAQATLTGTFITEKVKSGKAPDDIAKLNPSVSVSYRPLEDRLFYIRGMYKSTFRTPSFNDLYYYRVGSRNLRPEKGDEFDLGFTWGNALFPAMDYLSVTVDGYFNNVTDKIVAFPTTYAWKMVNFGKVRIYGLDLTLATSISFPHDMKLLISGAYTYQKALDFTDPVSKNFKHQLPYTPRNNGNMGIVFENKILYVGYSMIMVGKRYYLDQNIPANEISAYCDHTLTLSKDIKLKTCLISVKGELVNLTDRQYEVIKFYPMPGRSWRLTAAVEF